MLERASGCLEYGGRRLLSLTKKSIRSQRYLHSTFFCHGAGDIDLPSYWMELLQRPLPDKNTIRQSVAETARKCITTGLSDGNFLDFLYPAKTLTLIHKLAARDVSYVRKHVQRQTNHLACRPYTSEASWPQLAVESDSDHAIELVNTIQQNDTPSLTPPLGLSARRRKTKQVNWLKKRSREWYKEAKSCLRHRRHSRFDNVQNKLTDSEFLHQTHHLHHVGLDLSKDFARKLLEYLPKTDWQAREYDSAIRATLLLDAKRRALGLYKAALENDQAGPATKTVFELSITNNAWTFLGQAWNAYKSIMDEDTGFWQGLDTFKGFSLARKGMSILTSVKYKRDDSSKPTLRVIAGKLIGQFFSMSTLEKMDFRYHERAWNALNSCTIPTERHYRTAIRQLLFLSGEKSLIEQPTLQALRIWSSMRCDNSLQVESDVLINLFKRSCYLHKAQATEVFEDWRARFGTPPSKLFKYLLREMSYQGDLTKFKVYLNELHESHGTVGLHSYLVRLIQTHGRRGEVSEALKVFKSMPSKYGLSYNISSWNAIMKVYSGIGDAKATMRAYDEMVESGIPTDLTTLKQLLVVWATRGDMGAVEEIGARILATGIPMQASILDSRVSAYIKNEDLEAAKRVVVGSLEQHFEGSPRNMWNMLINAYALRKDLKEVSDLHRRMVEAGISEDEMTYAALMRAFSHAGLPDYALRILHKIMPARKLPAYSFHYAVVMVGFLRTREYASVFHLYQQMLNAGVTPDFNVKTLLVKAAAKLDIAIYKESLAKGESVAGFALTRTEELLDRLLENADPKDTFQSRKMVGLANQPINEAYAANYFDYLIVVYARIKAFDKVAELYDRYKSFAQSYQPDADASPPLKMLAALMLAYHKEGQHEQVERCWNLVFSKVQSITKKRDVGLDEPGWVLYSHRRLLCIPLLWYMRSLADSGRTQDIDPVLDSLHHAGYAIDNPCWNQYVQAVALSGRTLHAFRTAENQLMDDWEGWPQTLPCHKPEIWNAVLLKRQSKLKAPHNKVPFYETLVILAGAFKDMRMKMVFSGTEREEILRSLGEVAPRALKAVLEMPKLQDEEQKKYLRSGR